MSKMKNITTGLTSSWVGKIDPSNYMPLNKATYIELFFDLVFIFCIRSILPLLTDTGQSDVGWYSYYTFWFTFALMLQIWFNSTIFMNRFGTGRTPDIVFLFTNMFLLFVMTRAINISWDYYLIYNICWILITLNTMLHWLYRYLRIKNPSKKLTNVTRSGLATLGIQAFLVLISHLLPKAPAQIVCLVAMLLGFFYWYTGGNHELDEENREHLVERCALLMVLTFGETLIGFSNAVTTDFSLFGPITYFLLIVGMFLVYLNEIQSLLDSNSLRFGRRYMAISAWMTFCVANVTAGFEMSLSNTKLMGVGGDVYFGISTVIFLLSFFLYTPFNRYRHPSAKWIAARIIACLLVLIPTSTVAVVTQQLFAQSGLGAAMGVVGSDYVAKALMIIAVVAVYAVLAIDRIAVKRNSARAQQ